MKDTKKTTWLALLLALLTTVLLISLPDSVERSLKTGLGTVFLPLFGLSSSAETASGKIVERTRPRSLMIREIEALKEENRRLSLLAWQGQEALEENRRLREQLGWREKQPWEARVCRVYGRDPANWWHMIHIDLGKAEGAQEGLPVMTAKGLVGRILQAGTFHSQVVLIGDPRCRVPVVIEEIRENGILGQGLEAKATPGMARLSHLSRNSRLQAGQKVVTSGLGHFFPPGLPVGVILDTVPKDFGLYTEAQVKLSAELNQLEEVWVLFP